MFIYSMRATTVKFFGVVCIALVALIALVAFVPTVDRETVSVSGGETQTVRYDKVASASDAASFLAQFGWKVEETPLESAKVTVPAVFDGVLSDYNQIQKRQGLNLEKYRKKTLTRYTFLVTNYTEQTGETVTGEVWANVLVYKKRVVAGDICSADPSGFIATFAGD